MTRSDLIKLTSYRYNDTQKTIARVLSEIIEMISSTLATGERVQIMGLGTFEIVETKERTVRNPKTQEIITIPVKKRIRFRPSETFNDEVFKRIG